MSKHNFLYRPFIDLFSDSIFFAIMAKEAKLAHHESAFSRNSIMNSVFALECAANSLLEKYQITSTFAEKIDKFSILEKYEFVLHFYYNGASFDKGSTLIQNIKELILIRNHFVHARSQKYDATIFDYVDRENILSKESNIPKTQFLEIPNSPRYWDKTCSKKVLKSTIDFFDYFFLDKCKNTANEVEKLLFSNFDNEIILDVMHINIFKMVIKEFEIEIKFLTPEHV
jgi:hypothetical protein